MAVVEPALKPNQLRDVQQKEQTFKLVLYGQWLTFQMKKSLVPEPQDEAA